MINNKVSKICKTMKMSKYNIKVIDKDGNMIIYNFLVGLSSLTKVMKTDMNIFNNLYSDCSEINSSDCKKHMELTKKLLESGILVDKDIDEEMLYKAKSFEEIYDNRLNLIILPTGKCNFNCSYCIEAEQSLSREEMTIKNQKAVISFVQKNIYKYNRLHVVWFGGEPLLAISAIQQLSEKLITICKARCIPYTAETTTNGFCLDSVTFGTLYKNRVYNYMITVDGFKEQHDKCRYMHNGAGTYDTIMKNLIYIRDNKQYKFAQITIRINITRNVLDVIDEFIQYLDFTFSKDSRFTFLFVPVVNYSITKPTDETFVSVREVLDCLENNTIYKSKFLPNGANLALIIPATNCIASFKNSYVIAPDLKIYKCNAHYDMNDNCIGFIDAEGNMTIDETLHKKWYLTSEFLNRAYDSCAECFYKPVCLMNGRNCPYKYLKSTRESITCPLKRDGFIGELEKEILDAAEKYPCFVTFF